VLKLRPWRKDALIYQVGLASKLFEPYEHEAAKRAGVWDDWSTMSWGCRGVSFSSISIRVDVRR